MPLTKMRRPKFERQSIKQNLFTISLSNQRLHKIQEILKKNEVDCLLIIIGIDSRFNPGNQNIFNFLFFDVYNTRQDDVIRSKLDDFIYDDVMVCIKHDSVHVYCNGANYWLLLPYMVHWPGFHLYCISEIEMEDTEKMENFKIQSFIDITKGCNTVGVITKSSIDDNTGFDHMTLEDWPIVQSYGHDDFGRIDDKKRGFFTMAHKVVDLSSQIYAAMNSLDPVVIETFYIRVLPQIEGVFENVFQLIDSVRTNNDQFCIEEHIVEEPVLSYFKHLRKSHEVKSKIHYNPFVYSGINTRQIQLKHSIMTEEELKQCPGYTERINQSTNPSHMVIQCVNDQFEVVIARTVFFYSPNDLLIKNQLKKNDDLIYDIKILSEVYNLMIEIIEEEIKKIKIGQDPKHLDSEIIEENLKLKLDKYKYNSIRVQCDHTKEGANNETSHASLVILQVIVWDVRGSRDKNLGSLIYADTFIVSNLPISIDSCVNCVVRIGKNVGHYNYLSYYTNLSQVQNDLIDLSKMNTSNTEDQIEDQILIVDNINILSLSCHYEEIRILQACIFGFSDRIILYNRRIGIVVIHPKSIEIYEGDPYSDWCLLSIKIDMNDQSQFMIPWIPKKASQLYIVCSSKSRLKKSLNNTLLPNWNQHIANVSQLNLDENPSLKSSWNFIIKNSSSNLHDPDTEQHSMSIIDNLHDDNKFNFSLAKIQQININNSMTNKNSIIRLLCHLSVLGYELRMTRKERSDWSNISRSIIGQCSGYDSVVDLKNVDTTIQKIENDINIILTIICGPPFSGQSSLANKIRSLVQDNIQWQVIITNSMEDILPQLKIGVLNTTRVKLDDDKSLYQRIILIAPPMVTPQHNFHHIYSFINSMNIDIGGICTVIDAKSAYQSGRKVLLPGLLDMCDEGFCQTVLVIGPEQITEDIQRLIKIRNDMCSVYSVLSSNFSGEISKQLDSVLSTTAFNQPRHQYARLLTHNKTSLSLDKIPTNQIQRLAPGLFKVFFEIKNGLFNRQQIILSLSIQTDNQCKLDVNNVFKKVLFIDAVLKMDDQKEYKINWIRATRLVSVHPIKGDKEDMKKNYICMYIVDQDYMEEKVKYSNIDLYSWSKESLSGVIRQFVRQPKPKKAFLKQEDLTKETVSNIHKKRHLEKLPEGWFYNGLSYVHMDGSKSDLHPNLPQFLNDYLEAENEKIKQYNCKIDDNFVALPPVEIV